MKTNPKDYDAIIDFGSPYLFTKLQETSTTSSLDSYFNLFAGITKYIPYSLVASDIQNAESNLGWTKGWNSFINTNTTQIRLLQTVSSKADPKSDKVFSEYGSAQNRTRIVFTNTPFYCSSQSTECTNKADENRNAYEKSIIENDVDLVISGFGSEYERTYPLSEGNFEKIPNRVEFEEKLSMPVYITLNGPRGDLKTLTKKKDHSVELSSEPTFGILELDSNEQISFTQFSADHNEIDHFTMIIVEKETEEESKFFVYMIYGVLITCILGFGYFIYNWIRCIMSKPPREDDDDSSDSDEYTGHMRHRKAGKQELQNVLP